MTTPALEQALTRAWQGLQRLRADLPDVTFVYDPTPVTYIEQPLPPTVYLSEDTLRAGAEALYAALVHDAAHLLAEMDGTTDISRQGRYHNQNFSTLVGEFGCGTSYVNGSVGAARVFFPTMKPPHRRTINTLATHVGRTPDIYEAPVPHCRTMRVRYSRGAVQAVCACQPLRTIRIARGVFNRGPIRCGVCRATFEIKDAS